jgi:hypothetical protein
LAGTQQDTGQNTLRDYSRTPEVRSVYSVQGWVTAVTQKKVGFLNQQAWDYDYREAYWQIYVILGD